MKTEGKELHPDEYVKIGEYLEPIKLDTSTNILSVDVEDWPGMSCRTEVVYLLDLFKKHGAKATFFVLGLVAEKDPGLIREIVQQGHEVASHGGTHEQLFKKTPELFHEEMSRSLEMLRDITGRAVLGYRAPHFSVFEGTYWALDVLIKLGIKYDSSIFPIAGRRYGVPAFPRGAVKITRGRGTIIEVPLSTVRRFGRNLPVSGGGYFRPLPSRIIRRAVCAVNRDGFPFVVYCHPYEFAFHRLQCRPHLWHTSRLKSKLIEIRFNLFRKSILKKLSNLLGEFHFCPFAEALKNEINN